jgi:hypothetical protein
MENAPNFIVSPSKNSSFSESYIFTEFVKQNDELMMPMKKTDNFSLSSLAQIVVVAERCLNEAAFTP